jgi:hypothetical protein
MNNVFGGCVHLEGELSYVKKVAEVHGTTKPATLSYWYVHTNLTLL